MPQQTYPNQRLVRVHRERATADFLGIKNENWMAASRDLGAHALQLYLYLASNADNYLTALSPTAIRQEIGMARSTYHDQFHRLVDKGYLVLSHGNTYHFYEVPQSATQSKNVLSERGQDSENNPPAGNGIPADGQTVLAENTEINNISNPTDKETNIGEIRGKKESPLSAAQPQKAKFEF